MTGPRNTSAVAEDDEALLGPPVAQRSPFVSTYHGVMLSDDYAWLRAENWQEVMRKPQALDADIRSPTRKLCRRRCLRK